VRALKRTAEENGLPLRVLQAVEDVNGAQKSVLLQKIVKRFGNDLIGNHFALWGLSFKPGTDDMREATSRVILEGLWKLGATVTAYDPVAMDETKRIYGTRKDLVYAENSQDALDNADALIIVTEWKAFKSPDFNAIKSRMKAPIIFDGRNLFEPASLKALEFEYYGIGRGD
jgi:UDPglucose 6-dehydrogenase